MRSSSARSRRSWAILRAVRAGRRNGSAAGRRVVEDAKRLARDVAQRALGKIQRAVRLGAALVAAPPGAEEHEPGLRADADDDRGGRTERRSRPVARVADRRELPRLQL